MFGRAVFAMLMYMRKDECGYMSKKFISRMGWFIGGIIFTYRVLVPIGEYFNEPGLPPLVGWLKVPENIDVVTYQYWRQKEHSDYDIQKEISLVKKIILQNTNDYRLVEIYNNMNKNQNISIQKNKENNNIYVFTNSHEHISELTIYSDDGETLTPKREIIISHPTYRVGYGEYDEINDRILLGVIRSNLTESNFGSEWVNGETIIDLNK